MLVVLVAACAFAQPCAAQTSPAVRAAIQLASEGRGDSARKVLDAEITRSRGVDSVFVEALYWRARIATGGDAADRDLRRIAIEYGNSPWADDALLQLAQLAMTGGNPAAALEFAARLRADYPGSDLRPRAALWAGRAAFDVGEPRSACAWLDSAGSEGAADIEFVNQVTFYRARCTASVLAAPPRGTDTARVTLESATAPPPSLLSPGPSYEVQVAATSSDSAARAIVQRLARAGLRARVVPADAGIRRVRLGPFPTSEAADSAARAAARIVEGRPFVVRLP